MTEFSGGEPVVSSVFGVPINLLLSKPLFEKVMFSVKRKSELLKSGTRRTCEKSNSFCKLLLNWRWSRRRSVHVESPGGLCDLGCTEDSVTPTLVVCKIP